MPKKKTTKKTTKKGSSTKRKRLNPQQELFCQYYAGSREFYANGVASYIEAYNINTSIPGAYNSAKSNAYKLLTKDYILDRINEILGDLIMNDEFVDKQLGFLMTQNAELSVKLNALKEYNKLKQRITDKVAIEGGFFSSDNLKIEIVNKREE